MPSSLKRISNLLLLCLLLCGCYQSEEADLIIHNAKIYTVNESFEVFEAMAIKDGKIIELGPEREILNRYAAKKKIDAQRMPVYPGFIDAHSHFLGYARNKGELNLFGTASEKELVDKVIDFASGSERNWIVGRGWDQNIWKIKEFPSKTRLDSLYPDRPVILTRVDGHAALVNQKALDLAGIEKSTVIEGGAILLDENGEMTGILLDRAAEAVEEVVEPLELKEQLRLLGEAQKECLAAGLTTVTDAGLPLRDIYLLDSLYQTGDLKIGLYTMLQPGEGTLDFMKNGPFSRGNLSVRSVKLYADGALGSRGALLKEPYADLPGQYGLLLLSDSLLQTYMDAGYANGFQVNTHCIGDSANAFILKKYAEKLGEMNDLRWRIEHAQIVSPEDRHLFKDFAIIPSVQPVHATSDMGWAGDRLGEERIDHAYAYRSLKDQLGMLPLGTDFPVERIYPIENFYAAVFRKNRLGEPVDGYKIEEALTREEALRGITIWAAIAGFQDEDRGSLEPGKRADFVILDRDILTAPEEQVLGTRIVKTFLAGEEK